MALPHQLNSANYSGDFCFIPSFHMPEPFHPSSHDHHNRFHICFLQVLISTMIRLTHIAHRTILISAVAIRFISFANITIIFRLIGLNYLIYFPTFDLIFDYRDLIQVWHMYKPRSISTACIRTEVYKYGMLI